MTNVAILFIEVGRVRCVGFLQCLRNRVLFFWHRDQVNVIRHENVSPDLHDEFNTRVPESDAAIQEKPDGVV